MSQPLKLFVHATDSLSQAGVVAELRQWPEVLLVDDPEEAQVGLVVADEVDDDALRLLKSTQRSGCTRVVLVTTRIDDAGLVAAVEAGVSGLLRRSEATASALVRVIQLA